MISLGVTISPIFERKSKMALSPVGRKHSTPPRGLKVQDSSEVSPLSPFLPCLPKGVEPLVLPLTLTAPIPPKIHTILKELNLFTSDECYDRVINAFTEGDNGKTLFLSLLSSMQYPKDKRISEFHDRFVVEYYSSLPPKISDKPDLHDWLNEKLIELPQTYEDLKTLVATFVNYGCFLSAKDLIAWARKDPLFAEDSGRLKDLAFCLECSQIQSKLDLIKAIGDCFADRPDPDKARELLYHSIWTGLFDVHAGLKGKSAKSMEQVLLSLQREFRKVVEAKTLADLEPSKIEKVAFLI